MKNVKLKIKNYRIGYIIVAAFYILHFTFYIALASPARAQTVSPYCFKAAECLGAPYNGIPGGCGSRGEHESTDGACVKEASECGENIQGKAAFDAGYRFNCFAPPPTVSLQVSIGKYKVEGIEDYILQLYTYLVSIAAIVAGIMIVWAGFKWLTSGGSPERITDAKKKIANAIVGMALVFGSYLILQTVNPSLVRLRTPPVKMARKEFAPTQTNCVPRPEFVCRTQYNCSDPQYLGNPPCGARGSGTCIGQICQNTSETCARPITERAVASVREFSPTDRVCVNPSSCANCSSITRADICVSTACNCVWTSGGCRSPLANGQNCNHDLQCANRLCLLGNARCGNPAPVGERCRRGAECQSGLCNTASSIWGRSALGFTLGECVAPNSIRDRQPCSSSAMCQSNRCGYNNVFRIATGARPDCGGRYLVEIFGLPSAYEEQSREE